MTAKKTIVISLAIILLSLIIGLYLYPRMPEKMASHWNSRGQVDGYISSFWGVILMPLISSGILILFLLIPKIDPLKENIEKFRNYFNGFIILILVFLFYIDILSLLWNKGLRFDMGQMILPAMGFLFFYIGILISQAKRNWFIGIRTPWTLSNEEVWEKTHRFGGWLFKVVGVIVLAGAFFPDKSIYFVLIPILLAAVILVVYSYYLYQSALKKDREGG